MILSLRRRHRGIVIALGIFLPLAFALGIAARRPVPEVSSLPAALTGEPAPGNVVRWTRDDLWPDGKIRTALLADPADASRLAVALSSRTEIVRPDLLVYWVPAGGPVAGGLPADAFLLGALVQNAPRPLPLPAAARHQDGVLILYSLADNEIVQTSKPFRVEKPPAPAPP